MKHIIRRILPALLALCLLTAPVAALGESASRQVKLGSKSYIVTEFSSAADAPVELAQALAHPKLAGWECLGGATITVGDPSLGDIPYNFRGLVAFGLGDERMLATLYRPSADEAVRLYPVGAQALLKGREVAIRVDEDELRFWIVYPMDGQESERFEVQLRLTSCDDVQQPLLELLAYRRDNAQTGESVTIDDQGRLIQEDAMWYHVVTVAADGARTETLYPADFPPYLDFIDVESFPKSAEECERTQGFALPEDYGVSLGVHLRKGTSSRSTDLGDFNAGTLVKVLGTEPGDPYSWLHVDVGGLTGYMSGIYVRYPGAECRMNPIAEFAPLPVAMARKDTVLKAGTGWFDRKTADIENGATMHVLADCGRWWYVSVPQGDTAWHMDLDGTTGYIWKDDVSVGASAIQLEWMQ